MDRDPSPRTAKDALYEQFARVAHALASPRRLELIDLLAQAEKPVEVLSRQSHMPVKNTSAHLRVLRAARLVETRREGRHVLYRLADAEVERLARAVTGVARARLAEVTQLAHAYFTARDRLEPVSVAELRRRMRRGEVALIDVRPPDEYRAGHIPGARNVPLADLPRAMASLPRGREIVAYCRGPYCVLAPQAVELLARHGRRARRLAVGLPEWREDGQPVAVGSEA